MRYDTVCLESFGYALPEEMVTTRQIERALAPLYERIGLPEGRLELMTGSRERRFWAPGTLPSDKSAVSAQRAIDAAGIDKRVVGALIHASVCRDHLEPATAARVHHLLGLPQECLLFDVSNACLGILNGIHEIDCLRMLCGEIESIQAFVGHGVREFPVEDTAAAVIRFESGALGTIIISDTVSTPWSWEWTSHENPNYPHESQNSILVAGTKGSLAVPSLEYWWHEPGQGWLDPLTRRRIPIRPADAYVGQMRNLAQVIRGLEDPVVSGEQGLRTLAATLAIAESAAAGRPIRIDEMLERRNS